MNGIAAGALAGAAGTIALDITSYGDMALRGRGLSKTPAEVIRKVADRAGIERLRAPDAQADDATKNRRSALGALSGYAIGVGIGALYGAARPLLSSLPSKTKAIILTGLAMAAADVPAAALEATNPREWGISGWLGDIVPHAVYGMVTVALTDALLTD